MVHTLLTLNTRIMLPFGALIDSTVGNVGQVFCCTVMGLQIVALLLVLFSYKKIQNLLPWVHSSKCAGVGGSCIKKFDISFSQKYCTVGNEYGVQMPKKI